MFAYKAAVVVKSLGYHNIKIYNGGIKGWQKSGLPLESINPLPEIDVDFIPADTFLQQIEPFKSQGCTDDHGAPLVTILDFRNENHVDPSNRPLHIPTKCVTQKLLLDDLREPETRSTIPREGLIAMVMETGNRVTYAVRYLSQFGFSNIKALQFGMRGWIKLRYPTATSPSSD